MCDREFFFWRVVGTKVSIFLCLFRHNMGMPMPLQNVVLIVCIFILL